MLWYAQLCGWTMAHAPARSSEPAQLRESVELFNQDVAQFTV